jgi:hypothetical protein
MPYGLRVGVWVGLLFWKGQDTYGPIGKNSVSRNKDNSETHVLNLKKQTGGPQWHSVSDRYICVSLTSLEEKT